MALMNDTIIDAGVDTSDATAVAGNILKDKTAYVDGEKITGTMTNQGAQNATLNAGETYIIPSGCHNGSGKVVANNLASQTSGTAAAGNIQSGYTAWVNGSEITGTATISTLNKTLIGTYTITTNWSSSQNGYMGNILANRSSYNSGYPLVSNTTYGQYAIGTYTVTPQVGDLLVSSDGLISGIVFEGTYTVVATFSGSNGINQVIDGKKLNIYR